jgi:hypothetical protein
MEEAGGRVDIAGVEFIPDTISDCIGRGGL